MVQTTFVKVKHLNFTACHNIGCHTDQSQSGTSTPRFSFTSSLPPSSKPYFPFAHLCQEPLPQGIRATVELQSFRNAASFSSQDYRNVLFPDKWINIIFLHMTVQG